MAMVASKRLNERRAVLAGWRVQFPTMHFGLYLFLKSRMETPGLRRRQQRLPAPQVPKASPVRKDRMRKERAPGVDRARLALLQALQARLPVHFSFFGQPTLATIYIDDEALCFTSSQFAHKEVAEASKKQI